MISAYRLRSCSHSETKIRPYFILALAASQCRQQPLFPLTLFPIQPEGRALEVAAWRNFASVIHPPRARGLCRCSLRCLAFDTAECVGRLGIPAPATASAENCVSTVSNARGASIDAMEVSWTNLTLWRKRVTLSFKGEKMPPPSVRKLLMSDRRFNWSLRHGRFYCTLLLSTFSDETIRFSNFAALS